MTTFEAMMQVENQICTIARARAVLTEAVHYFECTEYVRFLPHYAEQILLLLQVAEGLLYGMSPELAALVDDLLEKHKTEKEGKTA